MAAPTTWLVMVRDVSKMIRVHGETDLAAAMVLDLGTGDILGMHMERTAANAVKTAMRMAATKPANRQRTGRPDRIICSPEIAFEVGKMAAELGGPEIIEAPPIPDGEEVFDSFIGHLSGRKQPREFATPDEWGLLFETAFRYCEAQPWVRWGDDIDLAIEVEVDGVRANYVGVVIGQEGIQRGLALYPGTELPATLREWKEGKEVSMAPGTLLLHLDPPEQTPPEFLAKARRYDWPQDAEFVPVIIGIGEAGPADLGRHDLRGLVLATAAVIALDGRGPRVSSSTEQTMGTVRFPDGSSGGWSIRHRPPKQPEPGTVNLRLHQVGFDLVPEGSPVSIGSMPAGSLAELRRRAKIHRPAPGPPPKKATSIPFIAIHPRKTSGEAIASRIAHDDPFGVAVVEDAGQALAVLACAEGAHGLIQVPTDAAAFVLFEGRLRSASGFHVLFVADEEVATDAGIVYGMFECVSPLEPRSKVGRKPPPKPKRQGR